MSGCRLFLWPLLLCCAVLCYFGRLRAQLQLPISVSALWCRLGAACLVFICRALACISGQNLLFLLLGHIVEYFSFWQTHFFHYFQLAHGQVATLANGKCILSVCLRLASASYRIVLCSFFFPSLAVIGHALKQMYLHLYTHCELKYVHAIETKK